MSDYKRYFIPGATYFFTVVTAGRAPLFRDERAVHLLGDITRDVLATYPATVIAFVLLPDHLHTIWSLPSGDHDYAKRWRCIKRDFTIAWLDSGGNEPVARHYAPNQRRRGIWQRRYWEHTIRDEADLEAYFDYIHYNPIKHGLARCAGDWPWTTFHRYVRSGHYPPNWATAPDESRLKGNAGE